MRLYRILITLQDPVYFATREVGRLYQTEAYLHNYALTYALGLATSSYHDATHVPHYQQDLEPLNARGIYVTPAKPLEVQHVGHTYKWADVRYHVKEEKVDKNIPTYGKVRELAPESVFEAFVLSQTPLRLPRWIRLGKWSGKALVETHEVPFEVKEGDYIVEHPLNPLDAPRSPTIYDLIHMPPVPLIENARFEGEYLEIQQVGGKKRLPAHMRYVFPED